MTESVVLLSISKTSLSSAAPGVVSCILDEIELQMVRSHGGLRIRFLYLKKLLLWLRRRFLLK